MTHRRNILSVLLAAATGAAAAGAALSNAFSLATPDRDMRPHTSIVRQVDQILIESDDPEKLFGFFTVTLGLPEAWPMTETAGYFSGGVGVGNINLAVIRHANGRPIGSRTLPRARFSGAAFEPYPLADALHELKARCIPHGSPDAVKGPLPQGGQGILWTTVPLPSVSNSGMTIFLHESSPAYLNARIRRKQLANRLVLQKGGALGIRAVDRIIFSATRLETAVAAWNKLLDRPKSSGCWNTSMPGPSLCLSAESADRIHEIVLKVERLERARSFFAKQKWPSAPSAGSITLPRNQIQGLVIRVTE